MNQILFDLYKTAIWFYLVMCCLINLENWLESQLNIILKRDMNRPDSGLLSARIV